MYLLFYFVYPFLPPALWAATENGNFTKHAAPQPFVDRGIFREAVTENENSPKHAEPEHLVDRGVSREAVTENVNSPKHAEPEHFSRSWNLPRSRDGEWEFA